MSDSAIDSVFAGSIPKLYEAHMVPMLFQPYAVDLANRLRGRPLSRVLELAAGTGVVTRALASTLGEQVAIVATDLNQAMIDEAASVGTARPVEWRQADAMQLPFDDESFDAVVCQFGAMFFPDKGKAFAQARRVLRPGGIFIFNVWDRIEENEFAYVVQKTLDSIFPDDPPRFMSRTPHGYHDVDAIGRDVANGGFGANPAIETVTARSRVPSAQIAAMAYCQGSPWRAEIEAKGSPGLGEVTAQAARAIEQRFGPGAVDGKIQAHVVTVER
jgi:SAM-dependent methyltransferase